LRTPIESQVDGQGWAPHGFSVADASLDPSSFLSAAFKEWLLDAADKTARAAKEGGFMGFGGVLVSNEEKNTIEEIACALELKQSLTR